MSSHAIGTQHAGAFLLSELADLAGQVEVLVGHGDYTTTIQVWRDPLNPGYTKWSQVAQSYGRKDGLQLARLDLAVIWRRSRDALALVEIEPHADSKKVAGDLLATLLGSGVVYGGHDLGINPSTRFIAFVGPNTNCNFDRLFCRKVEFIGQQVAHLKCFMSTPLRAVEVIAEPYSSSSGFQDLEPRLRRLVVDPVRSAVAECVDRDMS